MWWPLLLLLALGVALRIATVLAYRPAALPFNDGIRYLRTAAGVNGLFDDPYAPGGYPLFLRAVLGIVPDLTAVVVVQHLLGIAAGLVLYWGMRQVGAPRWAALVPAAVILLSGDQIYLEHTLLTESLSILLLSGGLACAMAATTRDGDRAWRWAAAAGLLLGAGGLVRLVLVIALPLVVVWLLWTAPRPRWRPALAAALAGAVVVGGYLAASTAKDGYGLSGASGWNLYGRVGQFADCTKFDPPEGTAALCEDRPVEDRWGASYYLFVEDSPALRLFGRAPAGDGELERFARAAILGQPLDYLRIVAIDAARYVDPWIDGDRPFAGSSFGAIAFPRRAGPTEQEALDVAAAHYGEQRIAVDRPVVDALGDYQDVVRFGGVALVVSLLLAVPALAFGSRRMLAALPLAVGLGALLVPIATHAFVARYAVPASVPFGIVAGLGVWALAERLAALRAQRL